MNYGLFEYGIWADGKEYRAEDADIYGESVEEIKEEVELMLDAFNYPIIEEGE